MSSSAVANLNPNKEMTMITTYINPPIPSRNFDWEAVGDNYDEGDPIGYGATEQEAIDNLEEQA